MHTVKEVATMLELSEHTVRYYTDKGLVPNLKRDNNNIRLFDEAAINWLKGVKRLRQCGMSLEDIKHYIELCQEGEATIPQRYEIIKKQKEATLVQLEEAKERAEFMINKANHYENILRQIVPDNMNPGMW